MLLEELLDKGGIVMAVILLLSVYVGAIILHKIYQFWVYHTSDDEFIDDVLLAVEGHQIADAVRMTSSQSSPIARVMETALRSLQSGRFSEDQTMRNIEASGNKEIRQFERHLRGLELVATISPLLGLLGTVIGMVKAFAGIDQVGSRVDPAILAGGIWEALLTTVAGLCVAIPALAAYYIIDGKIDAIRSAMGDSVTHIFSRVGQAGSEA